MTRRGLWVRWSWRDLRNRWLLVTAIALVIALGTGTYAALMGSSAWRTQSNDESFALLDTHDLKLTLTQGSTTEEGSLAALVAGLAHAGDVEAVRERLVLPTQVAGPDDLLVPGEIVGSATGSEVDGISVDDGRGLEPGDDAAAVAVLETQFAGANGLAPGEQLTISGGAPLEVVGLGQSPEYFIVTAGEGGLPFLSADSYGVLFTTLHTAQQVTGTRGRVNDVVLTLREGADLDALRTELTEALAAAGAAGTVTTRDDLDAYRILYDDIDADAQMWRVVALLVLLGAAFAALNLTTRIVEAQRREIGIGMALGVPPWKLAVRPLLFGAQVALLGVALGMVVGWAVGIPLRSVFVDMVPLPVWQTPLQLTVFAQAAVLGFVIPFAAIAWPVWRALRVQPVEAIRVGHLAARGGGLAPLLRRLHLPGRGYRQIPLRNVLRTPRRSALTALGIAASLTSLVAVLGLLDTFNGTLDRAETEVLHAAADRVEVSLDTFVPQDGEEVASVERLPSVGSLDAGLLVPGTAGSDGATVDLVVEVFPDDAAWTPTLTSGTSTGGLVLAEKAAADLGVVVGDTVTLEHPQATAAGLRTARTELTVTGLHPNPIRTVAYLAPDAAAPLGLTGAANLLVVVPADGATFDDVRRDLLSVPHAASAQTPAAVTEGLRGSLEQFTSIIQIAAVVTLLLALLIAFNTTSIGVDERSREHATMLAFGLPVRTVLTMTSIETVIVGAIGAGLGVAGGYAVLAWMTRTTIPDVMPELGMQAVLTSTTIWQALALGILTVAIAPLFTLRRTRRMDIPSALRVME
ncbi:MAG: FtsX-like permease family protein [Actinomycetota bacterium]